FCGFVADAGSHPPNTTASANMRPAAPHHRRTRSTFTRAALPPRGSPTECAASESQRPRPDRMALAIIVFVPSLRGDLVVVTDRIAREGENALRRPQPRRSTPGGYGAGVTLRRHRPPPTACTEILDPPTRSPNTQTCSEKMLKIFYPPW